MTDKTRQHRHTETEAESETESGAEAGATGRAGAMPGLLAALRRFAPLALLLTGLVLIFVFDLDRYFSLATLKVHRQFLMEWVAANPLIARASFVGAYALTVAVSFPAATLLTLLGGFLFGWWEGGLCAIAAATIGATIIFLAARSALGTLLERLAGPRLRRFEESFGKDAFNYLLFLRLVPIFPFWLVNLAPALLGVRPRDYILSTAIGIAPATLVYASLGNGIGTAVARGSDIQMDILFTPSILFPLLGLGILALVPVMIRHWRAAQAEGEA